VSFLGSLIAFRREPITLGLGGLGFRAESAGASAGPDPVFVRVEGDRPSTYKPSTISIPVINTALDRARLRNMRELGLVYEVLKNADPTLKSARRQRMNKLAGAASRIRPVDRSAKARKAADYIEEIRGRAGRHLMRQFVEGVQECLFEGGGFLQPTWSEPEPKKKRARTWTAFEKVPMTRVRYGPDGVMRFASDPYQAADQAIPVTDLEPGALIPVYCDADMLDYGGRGTYRTILADLFARQKLWADYLSALERFGNPIPIGYSKTVEGRGILKTAFAKLGSGGGLVGDADSKIELAWAEIMKGGNSPYKEFLEVTDHRILLAVLYATQTAQVRSGEATKQVAGPHERVQKESAVATWETISALAQRFLFAPALEDGLGPGWGDLAPEWVPDYTDPAEALAQAQAAKGWIDLGLPVSKTWGYEKSGASEPLDETDVLAPPKPDPAPAPAIEVDPLSMLDPPKLRQALVTLLPLLQLDASGRPALPQAQPPQLSIAPLLLAKAVGLEVVLPPSSADVEAQVQAFADNLTAGLIEATMGGILAAREGDDPSRAPAQTDALVAEFEPAAAKVLEAGPFSWLTGLERAKSVDEAYRAVNGYRIALAGVTRQAAVPRLRRATTLDAVLRYWREREVLTFELFDALADADKLYAWSTALRFEQDLLDAVHRDLEETIFAGGDVRAFLTRMEKTLGAFGRSAAGIPTYRLDLLFVQELTRAMLAGRHAEMFSPAQMAVTEGWLFFTNPETVAQDPEHVCSLLDGKIFRKDDPASYQLLPQLHFRCRCVAISVSIGETTEVARGVDLLAAGVTGDPGFDGDKLGPLSSVFGKLGR